MAQFTSLWFRRALSIGGVVAAFLALTATFPLTATLAMAHGAVTRTKWTAVRTLAFAECLLLLELIGVLLSFLVWIEHAIFSGSTRERFLHRNYRLQNWWGSTLAGAGIVLFDLRFQIDGAAPDSRRPFALFIRHVSFMDTVLPVLLVSSRSGTRLRYVLKRELLWDPCLDIVGNRLPNLFVARENADREAQLEAIRRLASGMCAGDGVLIFPEGTRFTPEKRDRLLAKLKRMDEREYASASRFRSVLPPRLGGSLAILDAAPGADAVFMAHSGLESAVNLKGLFSGALVGSIVRVKFWTVPREEIPSAADDRRNWFLGQWGILDDLVTQWKETSSA